MNTDLNDLLPKIVSILGVSQEDIIASFSKEYPECFCMVVLKDVSPDKMDEVCDLLRKEGGGEMRLCAQIIEEKHAHRFSGRDFDNAWEESWNYGIATIRMG